MYPQPKRREKGKGAIPSLGKIQKITLEWQTEQSVSVGSAVARVKGKHHDGDVIKLDGILCRQIRWYRELFRPVWEKEFFIYERRRKQSIDLFSEACLPENRLCFICEAKILKICKRKRKYYTKEN